MTDIVSTHINDPLARAFQTIVTGGWANKSDGNVESPQGHFALITIAPVELAELVDAFEGDIDVQIYPGSYFLREDSDGNATLIEYLSDAAAERAYEAHDMAYTLWLMEPVTEAELIEKRNSQRMIDKRGLQEHTYSDECIAKGCKPVRGK